MDDGVPRDIDIRTKPTSHLHIFKMTIILYHFPPSPPGRAAVMAARVLGLDIKLKEINLFKKEQLSPEFTKVNPQHTIPTLDDNGFVLWESRAIAGYLVRQYAKDDTLYPKNPQLKAVVDQRLYFDASTLWPRIRAITFSALFLGERVVSDEKKKSVTEALGWLEKFLHGRKWLVGDNCTIADISAYASVSSAAAIGWTLSGYPNITEWLALCKQLPGADENEEGAQQFGQAVISKLEPNQIP